MKAITYEKRSTRLPRSVFVLSLLKSCVTVFSLDEILFWRSGMLFSRPWWMRPWWRHRPQQQEPTSERTSLNVDGQRVLLPSAVSDANRRRQQELQALLRSLSYIPDLTERLGLIHVGYLELGFPYTKGATSKTFFDHLVTLAAYPFRRALGYHRCDLGRCGCGLDLSRLSRTFRYHDHTLTCGDSDILVPGDDVIYCAPTLILHYIRCHGYAPPHCFVEAVLNCPEPRSREYCTAIMKIAPKMITRVGEPLAEDEFFTVEFSEYFSSSDIPVLFHMGFEIVPLVERKSERAFRVRCATTHQLWCVLEFWQHGLADVCRTTTSPGDIEALCKKHGVSPNRKQFPQKNS